MPQIAMLKLKIKYTKLKIIYYAINEKYQLAACGSFGRHVWLRWTRRL